MTNEDPMPAGASPAPANDSTDMAVLRTLMAADRSLMAWVRTGIALISFGFTIYKFLQYARDKLLAVDTVPGGPSNPKLVGLFMIGVGIVCLVLGSLENLVITRGLHQRHEFRHSRYSLFIALVILAFGAVLFLAIMLKGA